MKQTLEVSPELRVALDLEAHEKECAIRYASVEEKLLGCLLYTSPSPRDGLLSRMPSSA